MTDERAEPVTEEMLEALELAQRHLRSVYCNYVFGGAAAAAAAIDAALEERTKLKKDVERLRGLLVEVNAYTCPASSTDYARCKWCDRPEPRTSSDSLTMAMHRFWQKGEGHEPSCLTVLIPAVLAATEPGKKP